MVASNPRMRQVKDRVTALKQEKAALKDTWFERNDVLNEGQDLQVSCQNVIAVVMRQLIGTFSIDDEDVNENVRKQ